MSLTCEKCGQKIHIGEVALCFRCTAISDFYAQSLESHLNRLNLPTRIARYAAKFYRNEKAIPKSKFESNFEKSVFLTGDPGCGKTTLAICMMIYHLEQYFGTIERFQRNKTFIFETSPNILMNLRYAISLNTAEEEKKIIEKLKQADFLIIDDFGSEKITDWALSIIYSIISYRYEEYKQTIYTSNLCLKRIARNFGDERITRRISEDCKIIEMK